MFHKRLLSVAFPPQFAVRLTQCLNGEYAGAIILDVCWTLSVGGLGASLMRNRYPGDQQPQYAMRK